MPVLHRMMPTMNTKSLTIIALVKAKPGKEAEMRNELLTFVEPSRRDPGCVNYDLHQSVEEPARFLFHENWASKESFDQHMQMPHLQAAIARATPNLAEPPQILLWERIA
jgi:quinol monooxygenase YgiN